MGWCGWKLGDLMQRDQRIYSSGGCSPGTPHMCTPAPLPELLPSYSSAQASPPLPFMAVSCLASCLFLGIHTQWNRLTQVHRPWLQRWHPSLCLVKPPHCHLCGAGD